jgi:hypothetical protein
MVESPPEDKAQQDMCVCLMTAHSCRSTYSSHTGTFGNGDAVAGVHRDHGCSSGIHVQKSLLSSVHSWVAAVCCACHADDQLPKSPGLLLGMLENHGLVTPGKVPGPPPSCSGCGCGGCNQEDACSVQSYVHGALDLARSSWHCGWVW